MMAALGDAPNITYADDSNVWLIADDCAAIKTNLEVLAERFVSWARGNGLAVNASKTQFLVSSNGGNYNSITVNVDGKSIAAKNTFELLGVTYNRKLNTDPHDIRVVAAVKQRAGLIARFSHHLPRGSYLGPLAARIFLGKISHALAAVAPLRLAAADGGANGPYKAMQVSLNNVCRTVLGKTRKDHIAVKSLHEEAKMPTINAMVTTAVAIETWKAYMSRNEVNGGKNLISNIVFESAAAERTTSRAAAAGQVQVPLWGYCTKVTAAANIWNASPALRAAKSLPEARLVAKPIARGVPL
jgi:hypothetical protein